MEHSHQPGLSHQQNKSRKAKHDSKRTLKNKTFGRVDAGPGPGTGHRPATKAGFDPNSSKLQRKNAVKAGKRDKRSEMLRKRRNQQENTAPKIVGFLGLAPESSLEAAAAILATDSTCKFTTDAMAAGAPFHLTAGPGRPANLTLAFAPRDTDAALDLCKAADIIVLVHAAGEDLDELTNQILSSVRAQGAPTVVGLIQNVDALPQKMRHAARKDFIKFVRQNFPSKEGAPARHIQSPLPPGCAFAGVSHGRFSWVFLRQSPSPSTPASSPTAGTSSGTCAASGRAR